MTEFTRIAVAHGDGIGPEIMLAVLRILQEGDARIAVESIDIGKDKYEKGYPTGIPDEAWDTIRRCKVLLKAPITTPQGGGYKSLNVTLRRSLGLYANVRPCVAFAPFVSTHHPDMDVVIIRENEEDLYAGIEHRPTHNVYQCLKLISRTGCERIVRYAFEYARKYNRKKVTCFSKDNIMKMTDGLFHRVFDEIAQEYSDLEADHMIIDIASAKLAAHPEQFDVVVTSNLYGDVVSDIAAEVCGSVGLAGSANIGQDYAMFEAIHGSAPDIAGQDIANPSGLLHGALQMLVHIGQPKIASWIHNAWLCTIEDGIHTADIYDPAVSKQKVGTMAFAEAVCERMSFMPRQFTPVEYADIQSSDLHAPVVAKTEQKQLVGVDVFVDWTGDMPRDLAEAVLPSVESLVLKLQFIGVKGLKVWPGEQEVAVHSDYWRLRFLPEGEPKQAMHADVVALLSALQEAGFDFVKMEMLYLYDGELGFTLAQGE